MRGLALLAGLAIATAGAAAAAAEAQSKSLAPTDAHKAATTLVYGLLSDSRYAMHPVGANSVGSPLLDAYLKALDEEHSYLEARDVEEFEPLRKTLGESIKAQDLSPAFTVFRRFLQRADERLAGVPALVAATPDFSVKESLAKNPGRWLETKELDARWRQKIKAELLELRLAGVSLDAARALLLQHYEGVSQRLHELESTDVVETFLDAWARVGHPGQDYLAPLTAAQINRIYNADPELVGVGMMLRRQGAYVIVDSLTPGGSAAVSGQLHEGDRLYGISESGQWQDLIGWRLDNVVERLRGKRGTKMKLRVRALDGAVREVELVRDKVALQEANARAESLDVDGLAIDAIRLPGFYADFEAARRGDPDARSASRDVQRLIDAAKARGAKGLVLDLRSNGGGSLLQAVEVAGLFLGKQPVTQVRESSGRVSVESGKSEAAWTGPLVVLVDEQSAAASEIVAAAFQDSGRALVVGQRTFGRGSVQNLIDLDRFPSPKGEKFGQVKLTIAELFRPNGMSLEAAVDPDIALDKPMPSDSKAVVGERPRMAPAAGYSSGPSLPVAKLRSAHEAHSRQDPGFQSWLAARAAVRREALAESISLNEAERRADAASLAPLVAAGYRPEVRDAPLRAAAALLAEQLK